MTERCPRCRRRLSGEHVCETVEERARKMSARAHVPDKSDRWATRRDLTDSAVE